MNISARVEIKKHIEKTIKARRLKNPIIYIVQWHDTEKSFNEVVLFDSVNDEKFDENYIESDATYYLNMEVAEGEDLTGLKAEQKAICEYLEKHFKRVKMLEENI